jgi:hypothetical protein
MTIVMNPAFGALRSRPRRWCQVGRGVHDDGHAGEADEGAGDVVAIGPKAVQDHAPGEGAGHEDAAIGGKDAAEVGVVLERSDEPVGG